MTGEPKQEARVERFARRYQKTLWCYLGESSRATPSPALALGSETVRLGLDVLALAKIHEQALSDAAGVTKSAGARQRIVRRAATFFAEAIVPVEATHHAAIENHAKVKRLNREIEQCAKALSTSHRKLNAEIAKRLAVEQTLRESESESSRLMRQSRELQEDLRRLSRRILTTQEEERKRISRELHDIVAQTLTAINVHLATLKAESVKSAFGMKRIIARTQKLVERSVEKVHRFARELRPAVLDDLGLIPAVRSLVELFAKDSGIPAKLTACAKVEELDNDRRTVLYRVAQEALMNVARHAHADSVTVNIQELPNAIGMRIHDNGRSFDVERLLRVGKRKRMGLLSMRERVEMVGGRFAIASALGNGTTITARVPFQNGFKDSP